MTDAAQAIGQKNSLLDQVDIAGLPQKITQAIKTAAAKTGVDFSYLLHKAAQESGFDPNAKASTSSATGLFQFTNQTWLRTIKEHGDEYGLGQFANQIKLDTSGVARVNDPSMRTAILNLRKDPQISAEMAGELDKDNLDTLHATVGGKIGATDLYLAHFLGAGGASDFLKSMKTNPNAQAANILPDAAAANPSVFYAADGSARSLKQIYQHFAQKFNGDPSAMVASAAPAQTQPSASAVNASTYTSAYTVAANTAANMSVPVSSASGAAATAASVMSGLKASNSSMFATMVLAQMGGMDGTSSHFAGRYDDHDKKSAIAVLGAIA